MPEEGASQRNLKLPSALGFSEDRKFPGVPGGEGATTSQVTVSETEPSSFPQVIAADLVPVWLREYGPKDIESSFSYSVSPWLQSLAAGARQETVTLSPPLATTVSGDTLAVIDTGTRRNAGHPTDGMRRYAAVAATGEGQAVVPFGIRAQRHLAASRITVSLVGAVIRELRRKINVEGIDVRPQHRARKFRPDDRRRRAVNRQADSRFEKIALALARAGNDEGFFA